MDQNKKRILVFSYAYYPHEGGAEIALREITERIPQIHFDIVTRRFSEKDKKEEHFENISVYRVPVLHAHLFPFKAKKYAESLYKKNKYTLIWSMMANYAGFAALFFKQKHKSVKFLLTLQEGDSIDYIKKKVWFVYPWFVGIFRKADHIQAISTFLGAFAKDMGYKGEISIVPNGIREEFIAKEVSWPKHIPPNTLITTSRLVYKNAVDDIISAMKYLPEHFKLHIVGEGKERKSLESLVEKLSLAKRVLFFGNVDYRKLPEHLRNTDIFVRPSRSEGFGSSFIEAFAAGLPVVGTNVGGISDFLHDEKTGFVCEVDNPKSIAEKISYIEKGDSIPRIQEVIKRAHALAKEKYLWKGIAEQMNLIFSTLF
jgi:glycosyltransferase involved in cell wall biosynthesis